MGTKLDLKEYCDGCPNIEPEARVNNVYCEGEEFFDVRICCKNEHKCRNIAKFLMKGEVV